MPHDDVLDSTYRETTLCLACSSSLPPLKSPSAATTFPGKHTEANSLYITECCQRPICPACISANPRLARYNPCLACLGGVSAVAPRSALRSPTSISGPSTTERGSNLDGAVRDEDTFVLGEDDDDDYDEYGKGAVDETLRTIPPPPYEVAAQAESAAENAIITGAQDGEDKGASGASSADATQGPIIADSAAGEGTPGPSAPLKYYLNRSDTLTGICLRFGVDSREVCTLNTLPPSVMRTTPHLLHTRAFILLPANAKTARHAALQSSDAAEAENVRKREETLVRERAERRLQTLTKEVDARVAKAYIALADDPAEREARSFKRKEMGIKSPLLSQNTGQGSSAAGELEALAIEQYLDDDEWEAEERRAGRTPKARPFPTGLKAVSPTSSREAGKWWSKLG